MEKHNVLTIGGATQDIYLHYRGADCMKIMESAGQRNYMLFEAGAKVEVEKILYLTGGGATNSAVSFKRLGFDTSCFCMVGSDLAGNAVLEDLKKEGVNEKSVVTTKEHATGTSFIINSLEKDRTIFAYRGANGFLKEADVPFKLIESAEQLYITSLSNESAKILGTIVSHAKKHNVPVAINPGVSQLCDCGTNPSGGAHELKDALKHIDILILNSSEAKVFMEALVDGDCQTVGGKVPHQRVIEKLYFSIPNFFKKVMTIGPKIVVVTDGAKGVYVAREKEILFHPSLQVDVVDTLGAGDSFGSCFVGCLRKGLSVEDSLRCGIVNSASVISFIGAKPGLLHYEELAKRMKKMKPGLLQQHRF